MSLCFFYEVIGKILVVLFARELETFGFVLFMFLVFLCIFTFLENIHKTECISPFISQTFGMGFNITKRKLKIFWTRSFMVKFLHNFVGSKNNFKPKVKSLPPAEAGKTYVGVHGRGVRIRNLKENTQQFYFLLNNEENTILSEFNYIYIYSPEELGGIRRD